MYFTKDPGSLALEGKEAQHRHLASGFDVGFDVGHAAYIRKKKYIHSVITKQGT